MPTVSNSPRSEESQCRFCKSEYGDWRERLTTEYRPATPVMAIYFEGQVHRVKVYPGPDGKARFEQQIRELLGLEEDEEFDVEFECKAPGSSKRLRLTIKAMAPPGHSQGGHILLQGLGFALVLCCKLLS